ncbi:UPF0287-domain-containing protein [Laetiporus sulphureus 93-53]|uniref:COX assembly mitochondrial protein n=1 Tax=Laetiporus sulphureus 93-53 TaxID=1314785 RepID=A0A165HB86_9APHY|nr:UPF0287-domain-containing protein [Laetiporus sulphureus 93-53]KZT11497.1 UPF0287-domain-containing protein [Laetiporus sulphureus 93-53]
MPPHLLTACKEFIDALNACHADGWKKWTGGCNGVKHNMNMCFRQERVDRSAKNREQAKIKRQKVEQVWKDLNEEQ